MSGSTFKQSFPDSTDHTLYELYIVSENDGEYAVKELDGHQVEKIIDIVEGDD